MEEFPATDEFQPESSYEAHHLYVIHVARMGGGIPGQMYDGKWRFVVEDRQKNVVMRREFDSLVPISHIQLGCDIAVRALDEFLMRAVKVTVEVSIPHSGRVERRSFYKAYDAIPPNVVATNDVAGLLMLETADFVSESIRGVGEGE